MHKRIKFYIGANNDTGEVELEKAMTILDKYYTGYTVYNTGGIWNGKGEDCAVVEVIKNDDAMLTEKVKAIAGEIKDALKQEAVLATIDTIGEVLYV